MLQLDLSDQQFYCLLKCLLYILEVLQYVYLYKTLYIETKHGWVYAGVFFEMPDKMDQDVFFYIEQLLVTDYKQERR